MWTRLIYVYSNPRAILKLLYYLSNCYNIEKWLIYSLQMQHLHRNTSVHFNSSKLALIRTLSIQWTNTCLSQWNSLFWYRPLWWSYILNILKSSPFNPSIHLFKLTTPTSLIEIVSNSSRLRKYNIATNTNEFYMTSNVISIAKPLQIQ